MNGPHSKAFSHYTIFHICPKYRFLCALIISLVHLDGVAQCVVVQESCTVCHNTDLWSCLHWWQRTARPAQTHVASDHNARAHKGCDLSEPKRNLNNANPYEMLWINLKGSEQCQPKRIILCINLKGIWTMPTQRNYIVYQPDRDLNNANPKVLCCVSTWQRSELCQPKSIMLCINIKGFRTMPTKLDIAQWPKYRCQAKL